MLARSLKSRLTGKLLRCFGTSTFADVVESAVRSGECRTAIDLGCGSRSPLTGLRPNIVTVGADANDEVLREARRSDAHDFYLTVDLRKDSFVEEVCSFLQSTLGTPKVDLVIMCDVIEHFPRRWGEQALDRLEELSHRFIVLQTTNGFVEQGAEYGNPFQRHLSGWFPHDFQARGYMVQGASGTKYLRGYMGEPRPKFPGCSLLNQILLARLFSIKRCPWHAFELIAIKDLRGTPARYSSNQLARSC